MKTPSPLRFVPCLILSGALFAGTLPAPLRAAGDDKNEQSVAFDEMPAAVQKTVRDHLEGGRLVKSERETRDGKPIFEVVVLKDDQSRFALEVAPDGTLLRTRRGRASHQE